MCLAQGPKHSEAGEARTGRHSVSCQAFYLDRVLDLGASCLGPRFMWAELTMDELVFGRVVLHPRRRAV